MTRRPIFIGVAAILALALTAGLAYGAGRLVGTGTPNGHSTGQVGMTSVAPGYSSSHTTQVRQGTLYDSAFRSQVRTWMQDWMSNHSGSGQSSAGTGYGRQGAQNSGSTGYANGASQGYWDDHHTSSGHRGGSSGGGYGYGGHWHDDCRWYLACDDWRPPACCGRPSVLRHDPWGWWGTIG